MASCLELNLIFSFETPLENTFVEIHVPNPLPCEHQFQDALLVQVINYIIVIQDLHDLNQEVGLPGLYEMLDYADMAKLNCPQEWVDQVGF